MWKVNKDTAVWLILKSGIQTVYFVNLIFFLYVIPYISVLPHFMLFPKCTMFFHHSLHMKRLADIFSP